MAKNARARPSDREGCAMWSMRYVRSMCATQRSDLHEQRAPPRNRNRRWRLLRSLERDRLTPYEFPLRQSIMFEQIFFFLKQTFAFDKYLWKRFFSLSLSLFSFINIFIFISAKNLCLWFYSLNFFTVSFWNTISEICEGRGSRDAMHWFSRKYADDDRRREISPTAIITSSSTGDLIAWYLHKIRLSRNRRWRASIRLAVP